MVAREGELWTVGRTSRATPTGPGWDCYSASLAGRLLILFCILVQLSCYRVLSLVTLPVTLVNVASDAMGTLMN